MLPHAQGATPRARFHGLWAGSRLGGGPRLVVVVLAVVVVQGGRRGGALRRPRARRPDHAGAGALAGRVLLLLLGPVLLILIALLDVLRGKGRRAAVVAAARIVRPVVSSLGAGAEAGGVCARRGRDRSWAALLLCSGVLTVPKSAALRADDGYPPTVGSVGRRWSQAWVARRAGGSPGRDPREC